MSSKSKTVEKAKKEIRDYYKKVGKRPSSQPSKDFQKWDSWLRSQEGSLDRK